MAEVTITLKLSAAEFQKLRTELTDHRDRLKASKYDTGGNRIEAPKFHALEKREASVSLLLEKLG